MSDTYLQDFGTRRSVRRSKPKLDPMAASGRWDDLYLRASKPRLKQVRRHSMRSDFVLRIHSTNGGDDVIWDKRIGGQAGVLLGFVSSPSSVKYKLDSPSYPSRARELSHTDKPLQKYLFKTGRIQPFNIRDRVSWLIRKLRFSPYGREVHMSQLTVLFKNRHELIKLFASHNVRRVTPAKRVKVRRVVKARVIRSKRVVPNSAIAEFKDIRDRLAAMDEEDSGRVNLLLRQRELYRLIWGQP